EDQRKPDGDEEQPGRRREAVKSLKEKSAESHGVCGPSPILAGCPHAAQSPNAARSSRRSPRRQIPGRQVSPRPGTVVLRPRRSPADQLVAGRSLLTSATGGRTGAPSTYWKWVIVPLPFSSAILPT